MNRLLALLFLRCVMCLLVHHCESLHGSSKGHKETDAGAKSHSLPVEPRIQKLERWTYSRNSLWLVHFLVTHEPYLYFLAVFPASFSPFGSLADRRLKPLVLTFGPARRCRNRCWSQEPERKMQRRIDRRLVSCSRFLSPVN